MTAVRPSPQDPPPLPLVANAYERTYLLLAGLFIAALVACNLIFQKFFVLTIPLPGGTSYALHQSVGILAYPLTFLVTDLLSEIYGARRANHVVLAGLCASIFTTVLVEIADAVPSAEFGSGETAFHAMFSASKLAVMGSMIAYLAAQMLDIRIYHFWRHKTQGRHLWLRNNGSTFVSQVFDTGIILGIYASFGVAGVQWDAVPKLFADGLLFKWSFALLDTPLLYLGVWLLRRRFPREVAQVTA